MTATRTSTLAAIRAALGKTGQESFRRDAVDERLDRAPRGIIPARGQVDGPARIALFQRMAEAAMASLSVVGSAEETPLAIATWLRDNNLPAALRRGDDPRLAALPWDRTALTVETGRSDGADLTSVSHAFAGVAETGTLALLSGPDNPTTLNFLPDNHVVVLEAADIVGDLESVWRKLRMRTGKGEMPRTVNLITGPSRSADIEQTLLLGAHGPRRLHIVLAGG